MLLRWVALALASVFLGAGQAGAQPGQPGVQSGSLPAAQHPGRSALESELHPIPTSDEADASRAGHGQIGFHLGYYDSDDSNDANPFYDESLTVVEPVVFFNYYWNHTTSIWGTLSYDYVSSASIARLDDYEVTAATSSTYVAQSGASGDNYFGFELGAQHHLSERLRVGVNGAYSKEYDYESFGLGADFSADVADGNATIAGSLRGFLDEVDIIRFDGNEEGSEPRRSIAGTLRWYQILDPVSHGEFGATVGYQDGFLATPYNAVVVEDPLLPPNPHLDNQASGTEIPENLAGTRVRVSLFGSVRRSMTPRLALELGGRAYRDTWGVVGLSVEPQAFHWLVRDRLRLRLRYRYYNQSAADDYAENFTTSPRYRTQDSDLGDFDSHTVGAQLRWFYSDRERIDLGVDHVFRSDYLDQIIFSLGWIRDF